LKIFAILLIYTHLKSLFPAIIYPKHDFVQRGTGESNAVDMTGPLKDYIIA